jgi:hypothetical protein
LEHFLRERGIDRRPVKFEAKCPCDRQHGIANLFSGEAAHGESSEQKVFGILSVMLSRGGGCPLVCIGVHDEAMHRFVTAPFLDEFAGEPIE